MQHERMFSYVNTNVLTICVSCSVCASDKHFFFTCINISKNGCARTRIVFSAGTASPTTSIAPRALDVSKRESSSAFFPRVV